MGGGGGGGGNTISHHTSMGSSVLCLYGIILINVYCYPITNVILNYREVDHRTKQIGLR